MLTATTLRELIDGVIVAGEPHAECEFVVQTDTRRLTSRCIFWALKGERFDGNQFALQALEHGASVAVVDDWKGGTTASGCVILVTNTLEALQRLARHQRELLMCRVVAITGSNGKTSTKDLTRSVLSQKFRTYATVGNFNNHIGLPLSILATPRNTEVAIYEIGMNHSGEILPLANLARPDCAMITNVGTAHIENLGSQQAIAEEKMSIARGLTRSQLLWIGSDNAYGTLMREQLNCSIVSIGGLNDELRAEEVRLCGNATIFRLIIDGRVVGDVKLPILGEHMVKNALFAVAAGRHFGMSSDEMIAGLESATVSSGRLQFRKLGDQVIIDDTYNANPESILAALHTLTGMKRDDSHQLVAVLGYMGEQGEWRSQAAKRIGEFAAENGISIVAVGAQTEDYLVPGLDQFSQHFSNADSAAAYLRQGLGSNAVVLFKGSRSAAMEKVMQLVF